jgi:hypothetical protein
MPLTAKRKQALEILRDWESEYGQPIAPREFARKMWPDSPGWKRHYKVNNGVAQGRGMWLAGGSYLQRLTRDGLVREVWDRTLYLRRYVLSGNGYDALRESGQRV